MDILSKINDVKKAYEAANSEIALRQEVIEKNRAEIVAFSDKQKELVGSFSTLVEMGMELGLCDKQGQPIEQDLSYPQKEETIISED